MGEVTAASAAMNTRDEAAIGLQIDIERAVAGEASGSMTVTTAMSNGLGTCHGGIIFSLADTVMGHASNAGNEKSVATSASIEWVKAAYVGDRLTATAGPSQPGVGTPSMTSTSSTARARPSLFFGVKR